MSDSRSSPLARLLMGVVTLIAGAFAVRGAPAAAPVTAAGDAVAKSAAAAVAVVAEDTSPAAPAGEVPGRFDHMAARLLALSQHDTARYARIEAGDSTGVRFDRETLGVVVATLPDPDDSHEDWLFDAFMESIRRAHERRGYVIHRMWLPWALGADSVLKDAERTPVRAAYPGVLVFRAVNEGARPAWRIVLLVGEVPTAGPHPRALARALAERDGLVPPPADTLREDSLAVLGPSYSGSASGLRSALLGWASAGKRRVSIITASASSATVRGVFSDPHFTFGATINSDSALAYTLASSLIPRLGLRRDQLAVIAEGSTVYGQAVAAAAVDTSRPTAARSQAGSAQGAPLRLFFPLNIATLRAAPGAARSARPQAPGGAGVTLDLTDAPRPMEAPLTTSELTAPTVDIALDQIARTLRNHDIRAVAIAASDIRDRLFLVTQLRARLRDVRFIVLEGNQLYLAPQYNPDLRGTLVLSSYPLILESQLWGPPDNLVPFSDEYAQALYNAALIHLGDTAALVNYAVPDGRSGVRRPPVWTSVVGGSGLMPLSVGAARVGSARADEFARDEGTAPAVTATPDPRLDFLELSVVLGLLSLSLWLLWRNHRHLREVMREEKVTKKAVAAAALGTDAEIFRS
ncbi:MAG TPA: hypothetical protein VJT67_06515, partial [Longimicrobiaceae bacterium]|nr:hypothetical protein [Longimicrobiaceae bacterium]